MYLASKSPQRKALLTALGIDFEVLSPDYREDDPPALTPVELVERHSRGKACSVLPRVAPPSPARPLLGADTVVVAGGRVLGKPATAGEARQYLQLLSGGMHQVFSGITLVWPGEAGGTAGEEAGPPFGEQLDPGQAGGREGLRIWTASAATGVRFSQLAVPEIEAYLATEEWRGRAGGYAIQGRASAFVEEIQGDYTNVVGLPVPLLVSALRRLGVWPRCLLG